jgi:hypothetical protein
MRLSRNTIGLLTALTLVLGTIGAADARGRTCGTPSPSASYTTLQRNASRAIHKQFRTNYFTRNAKLRVTKFKVNPNKFMIDRQGGKAYGYTATVRVNGQKVPSHGFIHTQRYVPRGHKRTHIKSSTPSFGIIVR